MPATAFVNHTGNSLIDGLLSGVKWAVNSFTFSFPTGPSLYGTYGAGDEQTNNFEAFSAVQQAAVRSALQNYASVANLTFSEITETSSQHADLRYAESDSPSTAWAYYPSTNQKGGDSWFNNSSNQYDNPIQGNYAWLTILHETGHALGLDHAHEGSAEPLDHDSLEYTVMSYRSYVGASTTTGYTNGTWSFSQTLMSLDVAALQEMYGANFTTNSGDTVYRWDPTTGQQLVNGIAATAPGGSRVLMNVWDGGGDDTYDFSNYSSAVTVDLRPGAWTTFSSAQLANLGGGKLAHGNISNSLLYHGNTASLIEDAIGGSYADSLFGNDVSNRLTGGAGNDALDGGLGADTAVYSGIAANYHQIHNANGTWTITDLRSGGLEGIDTLTSIEFLQFSDGVVALGTIVASSFELQGADSLRVRENSPNGTIIGRLSAIDPDDPDAHLNHVLLNSAGGAFELRSNGDLFVAQSSVIDFEARNGFVLTDRISNASGQFHDVHFVVSVEDSVDNYQVDGRGDRPDGSFLRTDFDNEDAFYWYSVADEHDAETQRFAQRVLEDDGIRRDITFDVYDVHPWDQVVDDWNAAGERDRQRIMNDDGTYSMLHFDVPGLNKHGWALRHDKHDSAGKLVQRITTFDDGHTEIIAF